PAVAVPKLRLRAVGRVLPTPRADRRWAKQARFFRGWIDAPDQRPSFRIDVLDPGHVLREGPDVVKLTGSLLEHRYKAALVQMNEVLDAITFDRHQLVSPMVTPAF